MSTPDGEMSATLHHRPRSPLEDEDLLPEILLRLPPQPSSLPRASAVCKRWRRLVSDRGFLRRYRRHHRRSPPLLGFFRNDLRGISYTPAMEAPDRVPAGRFSAHLDGPGYHFRLLSCRHGLVLISHSSRNEVMVWDPVTGEQHRFAAPLGFDMNSIPMDGAVLRAAGDAQHFQVVLVSYKQEDEQATVSIYLSETGGWSDLISTPVPGEAMDYEGMPAVLAGDSLYWLLPGDGISVILEVDLHSKSLAATRVPTNMLAEGQYLMVMRAEGGGLGVLSLSEFTAKLWKRNTDGDGVASWVLGQTIQLDRLLPLNSDKTSHISMLAYAEENNVAFLRTVAGIFMVELESLQFSKLPENNNAVVCYPFESVYAAGIPILELSRVPKAPTIPPAFDIYATPVDGAVLRAAAGDAAHHFQVVLVSYQQKQVVACVYSSETGAWSDLMSTPVQCWAVGCEGTPPVLVGDSLYLLLSDGGPSVILEVDLSRQSLALIQVPLSMLVYALIYRDFLTVTRAEGGGLGLLCRKGFNAQLWKMVAGCDGVASWVPGRTIKLDKLLSLNLEEITQIQRIAYAEENNVAFLRTVSDVFMVQLESLQFSKLHENNNCAIWYPLESVYAAETSIGGAHDGAD